LKKTFDFVIQIEILYLLFQYLWSRDVEQDFLKKKRNTKIFESVSPRADLFRQLLAATRRRRKITKPPSLGRAPFNQVSNFERAPFNQVSNFGRAPFNQVSNMGEPLAVSETKIPPSAHFN
jgi:hypothetical protein